MNKTEKEHSLALLTSIANCAYPRLFQGTSKILSDKKIYQSTYSRFTCPEIAVLFILFFFFFLLTYAEIKAFQGLKALISAESAKRKKKRFERTRKTNRCFGTYKLAIMSRKQCT